MTPQLYQTKQISSTLSPMRGKQFRIKQHHIFLLTFFTKPDKYEVKEVNGFILVRFLNKSINEWEVAVYTKENWEKVKDWKQKQKLNQAELL